MAAAFVATAVTAPAAPVAASLASELMSLSLSVSKIAPEARTVAAATDKTPFCIDFITFPSC